MTIVHVTADGSTSALIGIVALYSRPSARDIISLPSPDTFSKLALAGSAEAVIGTIDMSISTTSSMEMSLVKLLFVFALCMFFTLSPFLEYFIH